MHPAFLTPHIQEASGMDGNLQATQSAIRLHGCKIMDNHKAVLSVYSVGKMFC